MNFEKTKTADFGVAFFNPAGANYRALYNNGLLRAASAVSLSKKLGSLGVRTGLFDLNNLPESKLGSLLFGFNLAYAVFSLNERRLAECVEEIRKLRVYCPNAKIIITGPFASFFPQEALLASGADILLRGECEKTLPQFLELALNPLAEKNSLDKLPGLWLAKNGKPLPLKNSGILPILSPNELDAIKIDWSLARELEENSDADDVIYLNSSRGCRGKCVFCERNFGGFRAENPVETILKMEEALDAFPEKKTIEFTDDSFLEDKKRALELAKLFSEKKLENRTKISFQAKVDSFFCIAQTGEKRLDGELLRAIALLNVKTVYLGVESLSKKELARYGKGNYSKEDVFTLYGALEKAGVNSIIAYLILSNADTEPEDLLETLQGMEELYKKHKKTLGVDTTTFLMPFRQTREYKHLEKNGELGQITGFIELPKNEVVKKTLFTLNEFLMKNYSPNSSENQKYKKGFEILSEAKKILLKNLNALK